MRYMLFMIPNISEDAWGAGPDVEAVQAMSAFNQELVDAGVLLAVDGLHPASEGARVVATADGGREVLPIPGDEEGLVGGYWVIRADSREQALDWARKVPLDGRARIEVRRVFDLEDHSPEVQEAGRLDGYPG